jgi:hypothetical protein
MLGRTRMNPSCGSKNIARGEALEKIYCATTKLPHPAAQPSQYQHSQCHYMRLQNNLFYLLYENIGDAPLCGLSPSDGRQSAHSAMALSHQRFGVRFIVRTQHAAAQTGRGEWCRVAANAECTRLLAHVTCRDRLGQRGRIAPDLDSFRVMLGSIVVQGTHYPVQLFQCFL